MRKLARLRRFSISFLVILPGIASVTSNAQTSRRKAAHPVLLVANKGDHTVSIVDPIAGQQVAVIPTGGTTGHEVAVSPDGRAAYVPIYGNSGVGSPGTDGRNIVVIDIKARKVTGNIEFTHGVRPHCPVFDAKRGLLYVTTEMDDSVSIIDPRTLKIVGSIPTGQPESHMLAISHDGQRGYTANVGPGTVSVLDLASRKTITVIPISHNTQRISVSPDDAMVFTSDQTKPQLAVIDTVTNKLKTWVPLPATGYGTASTHDGRWLLVALPNANKIAVIDLATLKVARTIEVCGDPQEVLMQPDNPAIAYVSCMGTKNVAELNLSNWKVQRLIETGKSPDGLAW